MEGEGPEEASLFPQTVGEKLRAAREAQGLDLSDIAARTRIPQRHLEAIERSSYGSLPSSTYAYGFAKAYARAVGADEVAIGRELRGEIDTKFDRAPPPPAFPLEDPSRTPSRGLMWVGLVIAVLLLAGVGVFYGTTWFRGEAPAPESLEIPEESPSPTPAAAAPATAGQVSLVALDTVWLRVSDAAGKTLYEKEMQAGERFDVPADADRPKAKTGRPDKIQVVVNGSNVPPLGPGDRAVEVEVSAASLLARGSATPTPSAAPPSATPTPAAERRTERAPSPVPTPAVTRAPNEIVQPTNATAP